MVLTIHEREFTKLVNSNIIWQPAKVLYVPRQLNSPLVADAVAADAEVRWAAGISAIVIVFQIVCRRRVK